MGDRRIGGLPKYPTTPTRRMVWCSRAREPPSLKNHLLAFLNLHSLGSKTHTNVGHEGIKGVHLLLLLLLILLVLLGVGVLGLGLLCFSRWGLARFGCLRALSGVWGGYGCVWACVWLWVSGWGEMG